MHDNTFKVVTLVPVVLCYYCRIMSKNTMPQERTDAFVDAYEMMSEDPSQVHDNAGMDISPVSKWKTPVKIEPGVSATAGAGKDDDGPDTLQNLSLSDIKNL